MTKKQRKPKSQKAAAKCSHRYIFVDGDNAKCRDCLSVVDQITIQRAPSDPDLIALLPQKQETLPDGVTPMMQRLFGDKLKHMEPLKNCTDAGARKALGSIVVGTRIFRANLARSAHLLKQAYEAKTDAEKQAAAHELQRGMAHVSNAAIALEKMMVEFDRWAPYFGVDSWEALSADRGSFYKHTNLRRIVLGQQANQLHAEITDDKLKQLNPTAIEQHKKLTSDD